MFLTVMSLHRLSAGALSGAGSARYGRRMARIPKLKVFRLPVGFHDAYVAAPSQKAAIEAWGSDKDVFRRGQAEQVDDPKLTRGPLERPGKVIKRLRGTAAEQLAALGDDAERGGGRAAGSAGRKPAKKAKPRPKPSRARIEEAEAALAAAADKHSAERKALAERESALARERRALEAKHEKEKARVEARLEKAEDSYREAIRRWRG